MITPRFSCSQTPNSVTVRIYTPAIRASDIEIRVDDTLFSVHINPYFLRLSFPAPVAEDDASSAVYDPASGYLTVTLTKVTPGEDFKDLDVLAKLLAPPKRDEPTAQPTIEVIDSKDAEPQEQPSGYDANEEHELSAHQRELLEASENDWHLPQRVQDVTDQPSISIATERRYGFLDAYTGYFRHVVHTENEVNELGSEVESLTPAERRQRRLRHEDEKWDAEHYMADYVEEHIQELIAYKPPPESPCSPQLPKPLVFTEQENMAMLQLPRKEYLATPLQKHNLYLTLVTILFSYAYDARTTQFDPTPESAWTICSLTPAFSALDPPPYGPTTSSPLNFTPKDVKETLLPSFRRALAFPLYRSYALAEKCLVDVSMILRHGLRATLRALFETKRMLEGHEVYYVYSKIWLEDFCRWVASDASEDILRTLSDTLTSTPIDKQIIGWDLLALEAAALDQEEREPDSDDESQPEQQTTQPHPFSTPQSRSNDNDNDESDENEDEEHVESPTSSFSLSSTSTLSSANSFGSHSPVPDSSDSDSDSDSNSNPDSESESDSASISSASLRPVFSSRSSVTEP